MSKSEVFSSDTGYHFHIGEEVKTAQSSSSSHDRSGGAPACVAGKAPTFSKVANPFYDPKIAAQFGSGLLTDPHKIEQRVKQIQFGKNTLGYDHYISAVPKEKRGHPAIHPRTPNPYEDMPKRQFDGTVKAWRRSLHKWDNPDYRPVVFNRRDQNVGLGKRKLDDSSTASEEREEGNKSHKRRHSSRDEEKEKTRPVHRYVKEEREKTPSNSNVYVKEEMEKTPSHSNVYVKEEREKTPSNSNVYVKEEMEKTLSYCDVYVKEEKEKTPPPSVAQLMEEEGSADIDHLGLNHSGLAELEDEDDYCYSDEDVL
eukprot:scaffold912_cov187-Ochromonas_danica.AAC.7